jgi:hypothetical protein
VVVGAEQQRIFDINVVLRLSPARLNESPRARHSIVGELRHIWLGGVGKRIHAGDDVAPSDDGRQGKAARRVSSDHAKKRERTSTGPRGGHRA